MEMQTFYFASLLSIYGQSFAPPYCLVGMS